MGTLTRIIRSTALLALCIVAGWSVANAGEAVGASSDCVVATGNASASICGVELGPCDEIRMCESEETGCLTWFTDPLDCGGVGICCPEPE